MYIRSMHVQNIIECDHIFCVYARIAARSTAVVLTQTETSNRHTPMVKTRMVNHQQKGFIAAVEIPIAWWTSSRLTANIMTKGRYTKTSTSCDNAQHCSTNYREFWNLGKQLSIERQCEVPGCIVQQRVLCTHSHSAFDAPFLEDDCWSGQPSVQNKWKKKHVGYGFVHKW